MFACSPGYFESFLLDPERKKRRSLTYPDSVAVMQTCVEQQKEGTYARGIWGYWDLSCIFPHLLFFSNMAGDDDDVVLKQVWARDEGWPWWPAVILKNGVEDVTDRKTKKALLECRKEKSRKNPNSIYKAQDGVVLLFYCTLEHTWGHHCQTQPFDLSLEDQFRKMLRKNKDFKPYREEWEEALQVVSPFPGCAIWLAACWLLELDRNKLSGASALTVLPRFYYCARWI